MTFRLVKKPSVQGQFNVFRKEMKKQLQPVVDRRAGEYGKITAGWKPNHKPDFQGQVILTQGRGPTLRVIIRNASKLINRYGTTVKQLWDFFNEGTRPHIILPRFASVLRFEIGGQTIFSAIVHHPGTTGTKAKDRVDRRLKRFELNSIRRAGQKAWKAVERANKRL